MSNHGSDWDHRTSFQRRNPYWQRQQRLRRGRFAKERRLSSLLVSITSSRFGFDGFDDECSNLVWSRPTSSGSGRVEGCRLERLV